MSSGQEGLGSDGRAVRSAVVVVDDRLGAVLPAAAAPLLREAGAVYAEGGLPVALRESLGFPFPPDADELVAQLDREQLVVVVADVHDALATRLLDAGAELVRSEPPAGAELLDAVRVMDRLRSPGGCPWDAEQDHDSLRTYLVEETYELLDAIERSDRVDLREELGDVLLQVLFHARVAAEHGADPFDVDEVAAALVSKLVSRHPHVFAEDDAVYDSLSQQTRWEELKQQEKQRESIVDGVALGQPAVALAAKLAQRCSRAGIPAELLPDGESVGARLFAIAANAKLAGSDPEDELRATAVEFARTVRAAEERARAAGNERGEGSAQDWQRWLSETSE